MAKPRTKKVSEEEEIDGKNADAVRLGAKGGAIGGPRRAEVLSQKRRTEIARYAALVRWGRAAPTSQKRRKKN